LGRGNDRRTLTILDRRRFATLYQRVGGELGNRMQHQDAWRIEIRKPAEETLVGELIESLDNITADIFGWATDRLNLLQARAAREHREAREQAAFPLVEQVVAPLNRPAQRLLPAGAIASTAAQRIQR